MGNSRRRLVYLLTVWATLGAGCLPIGSVEPLPTAKDFEPNDDVASAVVLSLDASGQAELSGRISHADDVDVYDLGPVEAGDRIEVVVEPASGSRLDPLAGLFDADLELLGQSDDESLTARDPDSIIDHVVRYDTDHCYLAVTSSYFDHSVGQYAVTVVVTRGGSVPAVRGQTVLLDFDGATVEVPGVKTYRVGAFDPADVDARLAGRDEEVKQRIRNGLEDQYDDYDIDFVTTDDALLPDDGTYSRLVFGGSRSNIFGIAQAIDPYNQDLSDEALIFTGEWSTSFTGTPTVDELLISISNVAAHELGHLLGLRHTADITSLMDATGTSDTLLLQQQFKLAPVSDEVFPFGWQDAVQLLLDTLGPDGDGD